MSAVENIFEDLYKRFFRSVYYFFLQRGYKEDQALDLTQETFLRVYRGMKEYRGDAARAYVLTVAANVYRNALRETQADKRGAPTTSLETLQQEGGFDPPADSTRQDPLGKVVKKQQYEILREALGRLPPRMFQAICLRLQGASYNEIAAVMRVSVETVKTLLYQARQRLKQELGESFSALDLPESRE